MVFAGDAEENHCHGASYADQFGSYNDVYVQGNIKIKLVQNRAKVDPMTNKIILPSGTTCNYNEFYCIDLENGHIFWKNLEHIEDLLMNYHVLLMGTA